MPDHQRILDIMAGRDRSTAAAVTRAGLAAATPVYGTAARLRSAAFGAGIKKSYPLGRPTVSVGNLTTGGTGKTPMVQHLARVLIQAGHRPCILLRGYRGGDEAEEHKLALGDQAEVRPNPDRVAEAKLAIAECPEISCFILDDGFQHRRAQRDLDLVLLDATNPWGFGHLLPRGLLREPKTALKRADAVIVTRADQVDEQAVQAIDREVQAITAAPPIAHAEHGWASLVDSKDQEHTLETIADAQVFGIVAIGNPHAFSKTLAQHAGRVSHCEYLPDHHGYSPSELARLFDLADAAGASTVITTQKDWVKWQPMLARAEEKLGRPLPRLLRVKLKLRFRDGEDALNKMVSTILSR